MESDSPEVDLDEGAPGVDPYHGLGGSAGEQAAALRQPASLQWDKAEGFEDVARSLDSSSADNLLAQLDAVCTDWESESNPLTLHVIYKAPKGRLQQFKQWLQDMIVAQSEGFPGYRGTLLYTPKGLQIDRGEKSSLAQGEEPLEIAIAEARYHGARNFRAWLESEKRLQLVAFAREAGLLDPRHTSHRILEGHVLMVDCVWSDTPAEGESKADGKGGPELATWRLVLFTILNVWMASMLLSWPAGGLGDTAIATFGLPVGMLVSQFITVISVQWILVPCLQPVFAPFLIQRRPSHWLWHVEPVVTIYEGFVCFRNSKGGSCMNRRWRKGLTKRSSNRSDPASARGGANDHQEVVGEDASISFPPGSSRSNLAATTRPEQATDSGNIDDTDRILQAVEESVKEKFRELDQPIMQLDGPISVILKDNVRPDKFEEFETAVKNLGSAATAFSCHEYVGCTVIRPRPGSTIFTVILRFTSKKALEKWMRSDERRTLVAEKNKLIFSAAEARASTHTALDLLLTSRGGEQASSSTQGGDRLPPAKYKTLLVVVASLYSTTMALEFVWSGTVVRGLAFPLRMAIEVTVAAVIIGYLVIPALSTIGKRWLGLPRPDFYRQAKWRNFFVVRWVYEGFSSKELVFIIGATAGLLVGFGTTGRIVLE